MQYPAQLAKKHRKLRITMAAESVSLSFSSTIWCLKLHGPVLWPCVGLQFSCAGVLIWKCPCLMVCLIKKTICVEERFYPTLIFSLMHRLCFFSFHSDKNEKPLTLWWCQWISCQFEQQKRYKSIKDFDKDKVKAWFWGHCLGLHCHTHSFSHSHIHSFSDGT